MITLVWTDHSDYSIAQYKNNGIFYRLQIHRSNSGYNLFLEKNIDSDKIYKVLWNGGSFSVDGGKAVLLDQLDKQLLKDK